MEGIVLQNVAIVGKTMSSAFLHVVLVWKNSASALIVSSLKKCNVDYVGGRNLDDHLFLLKVKY